MSSRRFTIIMFTLGCSDLVEEPVSEPEPGFEVSCEGDSEQEFSTASTMLVKKKTECTHT